MILINCTGCGFDNPGIFRFCGGCGKALVPERLDPTVENRPLTVMFCDLVGSTELSTRLHPERLRDVLRAYQASCAACVERYDGHIAQYLGDGVLVYFGYPKAHEDDAYRAIRAGLDIIAEVPNLETDVELAVRIGIHTGAAITGEVGSGVRREQLALGETPNVAARLLGMAHPNELVISAATWAQTPAQFQVKPLGPQNLKGLGRPVEAFRVLRTAIGDHRFTRSSTIPLVGTQAHLHRLLNELELAAVGEERLVLLEGDAGIGKSRLVLEFQKRVGTEAVTVLVCQCQAHETHTALHPIRGLLRSLANLQAGDDAEQRLVRLEELLQSVGCASPETVTHLAALLAIPTSHRYPEIHLSPEMRKASTLRATAEFLRAHARTKPAVIILEDAHWSDPTTQELMTELTSASAGTPLLMILTYRTGFMPSWSVPQSATRIRLAQLNEAQSAELIRYLAGEQHLPAQLFSAILAKTDGVPLFIEQLTRSLLETAALDRSTVTAAGLGRQHHEGASAISLPTSLQGSLMARLDRLDRAKHVAQLAAVIGRTFERQVIQAAAAWDVASLDAELAVLVDAEILDEDDDVGERYTFRHALVQDAAYHSLARGTRQRHHKRVAEVLMELRPEVCEERPELIAHHWSLGNLPEKAATLYKRAGERASGLYANEEAITFFQRGVRCVRQALCADEEGLSEQALALYSELCEGVGSVATLIRLRDTARAALRAALAQVPYADSIREARLHRLIGALDEQNLKAASRSFDLAEAALGAEPDDDSEPWRREWVHIQLDRIRMHYWQGQNEAMHRQVARVRPYIERYATPAQRSSFYYQLVLSRFRPERYQMSDETLAHARLYVQASEELGDIVELSSALFVYGFVLLFRGHLLEAERLLVQALEACKKSGNRTIQVRVLAYISTLFRRQDRPEDAHRTAHAALQAARAANMVEYEGVAKANLSWVALRAGQVTAAEQHAASALEDFAACEMPYPFRWTALFTKLAVAVERGQHDESTAQIEALLADDQQQLPETIWRALQSFDARAAIDSAEREGYLPRSTLGGTYGQV